MQTRTAQYIKKIEIHNLWRRGGTIKWELNRDINILSGINGVGKSTILNAIITYLENQNDHKWHTPKSPISYEKVHLTFEPSNHSSISFDVIQNVDHPLMLSEPFEKLTNEPIITELDCQLFKLQKRYLNYQVNLSNAMIQQLTSNDNQQNALFLAQRKTHFQDLIDELFSETNKKIDRSKNELSFLLQKEVIHPYQLSSGEKQILIILTTVLTQNHQPYVLLMDEPEISLHIEWQQKLIALIQELNPNVQIILTTHSPAMIMEGWIDKVVNVEELLIYP